MCCNKTLFTTFNLHFQLTSLKEIHTYLHTSANLNPVQHWTPDCALIKHYHDWPGEISLLWLDCQLLFCLAGGVINFFLRTPRRLLIPRRANVYVWSSFLIMANLFSQGEHSDMIETDDNAASQQGGPLPLCGEITFECWNTWICSSNELYNGGDISIRWKLLLVEEGREGEGGLKWQMKCPHAFSNGASGSAKWSHGMERTLVYQWGFYYLQYYNQHWGFYKIYTVCVCSWCIEEWQRRESG